MLEAGGFEPLTLGTLVDSLTKCATGVGHAHLFRNVFRSSGFVDGDDDEAAAAADFDDDGLAEML